MIAPSTRHLSWMLLFLPVLWWTHLGYRPLMYPDEGRYAEIAREMLVRGDFITPHLNAIEYFEKPPLHYWMTAFAYQLFGITPWAARFWPACSGLLLIFLTALMAKTVSKPPAAHYAALILATSPLFFFCGHFNSTDMGLTLFTTATIYAMLQMKRHKKNHLWALSAWVTMACATLTKGIIGFLLPLGALAIDAYRQRTVRETLKALHITTGLVAFLALTLPWFVVMARRHPDFIYFFFIHEHVLRYLHAAAGHSQPLWQFLGVCALTLLPWTPLLCQPYDLQWCHRNSLLITWCLVVLAFFGLSHSQLVSYILPIFPATALIIAHHLTKASQRSIQWSLLSSTGCIALILLAISHQATPPPPGPYPSVLTSAVVLLAIGLISSAFSQQKTTQLLVASLSTLLFLVVTTSYILTTLAPRYSGRDLAIALMHAQQHDAHPSSHLYAVQTYEQTLPFYLGHTIDLVAYTNEFSYGLSQQKEKSLTVQNLLDRLHALSPTEAAYLLLAPHTARQYQHVLRPFCQRVIFANKYIVLRISPKPCTHNSYT